MRLFVNIIKKWKRGAEGKDANRSGKTKPGNNKPFIPE
jgi:hypothetical protein